MIFSMSIANLINTIFISVGIGVCLLCLLQISASKHIRKDARRYFQVFFIFLILYLSTHLIRQLMDGVSGNGVRIALYAVTFVEIFTAGFTAFMMSILVMAVARRDKNNKVLSILFLSFLIAHLILLIASAPFGFVYYFDEANVYHRGAGYITSNVFPILMLVTDIVLLIVYRKNLNRRIKSAFWNYMIAPIVAISIQGFIYDIQLIFFATVGAAVYMFAVIVQEQNEMYEKSIEKNSRIESELNLASNIQADMLPNIYPAFPERPEFDIYASMDPAKEVGGDFYDFFLVDEDHLCMIMADVSGKGVPAALFMMASKIILANNAMLGKSPAKVLKDTNEAICQNNREEMFVTVWLGILELSTGKLTYANAGHENPVLREPDGEFTLIREKHGFVLGGMTGMKYKDYELQMKPGARLFLYTDGVPEATDANNNLFGTDRMVKALNESESASPEGLLKDMRKEVDKFVSGAEQFDDITMMGVEYLGPEKK